MSEEKKSYWPSLRSTIYDLRLRNDDATVIDRIKHGLCNATFQFYDCVFKGKPWPKEVGNMEREWIETAVRAIWDGEGFYTPGFNNETDEFLDAIGLPRRERAGLIRSRVDCEGLVCAQCGKIGKTLKGNLRKLDSCYDHFHIFPDGRTLCYWCDGNNNLFKEG